MASVCGHRWSVGDPWMLARESNHIDPYTTGRTRTVRSLSDNAFHATSKGGEETPVKIIVVSAVAAGVVGAHS